MKNYIKIIKIFVILIFMFCDKYYPKGYLTGIILDKSNSPISNVSLEILGRTVLTNDDGQYFIDKIPAGQHKLTLKLYGK